MAYFNGVRTSSELGTLADVENIEKSLSAGYGTDSATYVNGRAMIPEDLEATVVNVVAKTKDDCKVLNTIKKTPAKSTVHEFNRRTGFGDFKHLTTAEGGASANTRQSIDRQTVAIKYLQTKRSVTRQMEVADTFENAYASEKIAGIETITQAIEHLIFHGNSSVVDTEFDGFISSVKKLPETKQSILDLKGKSIGSYGEKLFDDIAFKVREKGGFIEKALYPIALGKDVKELFEDRQRYIMNNSVANFSYPSLPPYGTAVGANIALDGEGAGGDMFYEVKGKVQAEGDVMTRPQPVASVTASAATNAKSKFVATDAGDYKYTVHAVNASGISAGVDVTAVVSVAAGDGVTLTITPASTGAAATGFIICRSAKDGTEVYEMDSIGIDTTSATTSYVDLNEELPGTASMLFLPKASLSPAYDLAQLLPVCTYPLYPTDKAETPFLILAYIALAVKAPERVGLVKNIAYSGGLY